MHTHIDTDAHSCTRADEYKHMLVSTQNHTDRLFYQLHGLDWHLFSWVSSQHSALWGTIKQFSAATLVIFSRFLFFFCQITLLLTAISRHKLLLKFVSAVLLRTNRKHTCEGAVARCTAGFCLPLCQPDHELLNMSKKSNNAIKPCWHTVWQLILRPYVTMATILVKCFLGQMLLLG